jgi:hypothetical protein
MASLKQKLIEAKSLLSALKDRVGQSTSGAAKGVDVPKHLKKKTGAPKKKDLLNKDMPNGEKGY